MAVEHQFLIEKELIRGLKPDTRNVRNTPALEVCRNLKPFEFGLTEVPPVVDPFGSTAITWPFPQLIRGKKLTFLAGETVLYEVDETTVPWGLRQVITYDALSPLDTKAIVAGGPWHMLDFHDVFMLFNGNCAVLRSNYEGIVGDVNRTYVYDGISIRTGVDFRGRAVMAGFSASPWTDQWRTLIQNWMGTGRYAVNFDLPLTPNFVMWSTIGGGDMLWFLYPQQMLEGIVGSGHDVNTSLFQELEMRNERGFMPMPWQGAVQAVKPLGKAVMVYGDSGVSAMPLAGGHLGLVELLNFGIASRGAVGGGGGRHIFIDEGGALWVVDAELSAQKLGYEQYLQPMLGSHIVVSEESREGDFYITNGVKAFLLSRTGLAEVCYAPTGLAFTGGGIVGVNRQVGDLSAEVLTDVIDLGVRTSKTIHSIEVGTSAPGDISVAIDYRRDKGMPFTRSEWFTLRGDGKVVVRITGIEFRFCVKASSYIGLTLDYIKVNWRTQCKRDSRQYF